MKSGKTESKKELSFWEHLEALRWMLFRCIGVVLVFSIAIFTYKDFIFNKIIFSPLTSDFYTYRLFCNLANLLHLPALCPGDFKIGLINISLSGQFMLHMTTSLIIALVIAVPYLLYEIWKFVSPALYPNEKKGVNLIFMSSSILFYLGAVLSYYTIFPFTLRFLGTYQISNVINNQVSIQSYLNTMALLVFFMGIAFELPVIIYLLSTIGILNKDMLKKARRYVLVIILIISALITPTSDPFTMSIVAAPIYLLYELSILVCKKENENEIEENSVENNVVEVTP